MSTPIAAACSDSTVLALPMLGRNVGTSRKTSSTRRAPKNAPKLLPRPPTMIATK